MRLLWTPRRRKAAARLAEAKKWQAEERAAALERLLDLADITPEWKRGRS